MGVLEKVNVRGRTAAKPVPVLPLDQILRGDCIAHMKALPDKSITFLAMADRVELTEVHITPAGDAVVPGFDPGAWRETAREDMAAEAERPAYSYVTLERVR